MAPVISLVTIVLNEEHHLERMIESARGVVDEFIIVDTGSTDRTVHLARTLGATVFQWGPSTNFSEPRNFGLTKAKGDWVLHLDADDQLLWAGQDAVLNLVEQPLGDLTGYCFAIYEDCEAPFITPSSGRLFKREGAFYKGHVHMQIQGGRWALLTDGPHIKHDGYLTRELRVSKLTRNVELLKLDIEDDPDDPDATYYLAISLKDLRREDEADYWARRALAIEGRPPWVVETLESCLKGNNLKVEWYGRTSSTARVNQGQG